MVTNADVAHVCYKKFCTHTVSLLMSHRPSMKVSEALKRQEEWKSGKVNENLKTFYKQLLVGFEGVEVVEMLRRILEKQEVNWAALLSFLATFLVASPAAATAVQDHVKRLLSESLETGDLENTIVAVLLARQSCAEGAHVFPAYPQWFQELFSDAARSPATSKKSFTFLVKFLTDLVPFEPASVLKVPLEETNAAIYSDQEQSAQQECAGIQDVEKAVAAFESNGKLPITVMEASIFRKPYFVGKFLPALLQARHLPDVPDGRMKLIEALKRSGKIPSSLFSKYEEACRKETTQLLEGVFEIDDYDEGVEEMEMEPVEQLDHRLKQLTQAVLNSSTQTRVSEIVSIISEKIENLIGSPPAMAAVATETKCVIDLCQPKLLPSHVQVVDAMLECVCRTLHQQENPSQHSWLRLLTQMLSQHSTLHPALSVRLLTLVCNESSKLAEFQVEGCAALLFHISDSASLYPPLLLSHPDPPRQEQTTLLGLLTRHLPVGRGEEMKQSLLFLTLYLKTAHLCLAANSGDEEAIFPPPLVKLFALLCWRLFPDTRPHSETMSATLQFSNEDTEGHRGREVMSRGLYASDRIQNLLKATPLTLEDWLDLEMRLEPCSDTLSPLERQTFQYSMVAHFSAEQSSLSPGDSQATSTKLLACCSTMLSKLAKGLERGWKQPVQCPMCRRVLCYNASSDQAVNTEAVSSLLFLLARLMQNLPAPLKRSAESQESDSASRPWLIGQIDQMVSPSSRSDCISPLVALRILLRCPPYLLFTNWGNHGTSDRGLRHSIKFIENFLVPHASEGGVLSLDTLCHILQSYFAVKDQSDEATLKPFEDHPVLVLSLMVHWSAVSQLLPGVCHQHSPWADFAAMTLSVNRVIVKTSAASGLAATSDPFCQAAAIYAAILRGSVSDLAARQSLIHHLESQSQVAAILNELLLLRLTFELSCDWDCSRKSRVLEVLPLIWQRWPRLLLHSADSDRRPVSELSRVMQSSECQAFKELAVLRCVQSVPAESVVREEGVLTRVVQLYAALCRRFDAHQPSQKAMPVDPILDLSKTVVTLINTAPSSALRLVDMDTVKTCGLEIFRVFQQRLKS